LPVAEKVNPDAANVKPTMLRPIPRLLFAAIFHLLTTILQLSCRINLRPVAGCVQLPTAPKRCW
jgi:hypothetical protein